MPIAHFSNKRGASLAFGAGLVCGACSVDYRADQKEFDRRLCVFDAAACVRTDGGADAHAGGGRAGAGGSTGGTGGGVNNSGGGGGAPTGGASGAGGGGLADAPVPCLSGTKDCRSHVARECVGGAWVETPCSAPRPACEGGACVVCVSGAGRCNARIPELCVADTWVPQGACPATAFCETGTCVTPPSCDGLAATCGPTKNESCCTSLPVAGGTFFRNNDRSQEATVSDFLLDKYEITVGRFRAFVAAFPGDIPSKGSGSRSNIAGTGWDDAWTTSMPVNQGNLIAALKCNSYSTWTDTPGAADTKPMNCLSWYFAFAFCAWDGGYLPTDAEWDYAATGGTDQRRYPWGDTDPGFTATYAAFGCYYAGTGGGCSLANIAPVGQIPAGNGKYGHADLAGNLGEWILDGQGTPPVPCIDCVSLTSTGTRVVRGGYFSDQASSLLNSARGAGTPVFGGSSLGARCARRP